MRNYLKAEAISFLWIYASHDISKFCQIAWAYMYIAHIHAILGEL